MKILIPKNHLLPKNLARGPKSNIRNRKLPMACILISTTGAGIVTGRFRAVDGLETTRYQLSYPVRSVAYDIIPTGSVDEVDEKLRRTKWINNSAKMDKIGLKSAKKDKIEKGAKENKNRF